MGPQTAEERQKYLHNFARTLAGQLGLQTRPFVHYKSAAQIAQKILYDHNARVWERVNTLSDETIGKLACGGNNASEVNRVSFQDVHEGRVWLQQDYPGLGIVRVVAVTSIIAAIADNFWTDIQKQKRKNDTFVDAVNLVQKTTHADDLVHLLVEDHFPSEAKDLVAARLMNMWKDRSGGITLDHLVYIGDHADEPYKSEANEIIRNHT